MNKKKRIYTVATAHLDTIWSWDFETTVSKYIYNTLVDNFQLFEKYPNYTFSFEGTYRYELMEEYYPELFEKMKGYVKSGRWNVCGSSFENGDVNVPSPEALFRNILFGNRYFDKTFGKRSVDIYLPDCFGFGWALPSVAHHANLKGFTTQKLAWGSAYGIPFDIGKWQGVDGSEIYASVNPHDYYFTLTQLRDWDFVQKKLKENEKYDLDWTYIFHGIGDRGGAPKEKSVQFVEQEISKNAGNDIEVIAASADQIYHDIETELTPEQREKLPVWKNELVMQNHAVGGYTSRAIGKRWNRRCEELADMAERAAVTAHSLGLLPYPQATLNRAWKRFIAHQFHDDIPGTSVQRAYRRSWNDYAVSMNQFQTEYEASAGAVCSQMKTDFCQGQAVTIHNPDEFERTEVVALEVERLAGFARVFDAQGNEVPAQSRILESGKTQVLFKACVPALGLRVYDLQAADVPCMLDTGLRVTKNTLENEKYTVTLNENGDICSILDKALGNRELLKAPVTLGLFKYTGSKDWPAWEMNYKEINKEADRIPKLQFVEILENGPACAALRVVQRDDRSEFRFVVSLTAGGEIVRVQSEIEWQSLQTLAKHKFAFTCQNKTATFDLGLGAIERGNMSEKLFEVPAQKWADITDTSKEYGVSVLSECKYGWDKRDDSTLRLTVLHTPKRNYRIDSMQSMLDLGLNRYSFAIFSHSGAVGEATQRAAKRFVQPMAAFLCDKHDGALGTSYSFGALSDSAVLLRAVKLSEDGGTIVVRFNEGIHQARQGVQFTLGNGIESATEIYASEEFKADAVVKNGALVFDLAPYEIKSFALKLKAPAALIKNGTALDLPMNTVAFTSHQNLKEGELDICPAKEVLPRTVVCGGTEFRFADTKQNALLCRRQTIALPEGTETVSLLLCSRNGDKTIRFKADDKVIPCKVFDAFERFAAWDLYDFKETAYIKDGKIGLEITHCHNADGDLYAKQFYLYKATVSTQGAKTLTLPDDNDILIAAAVSAEKEHAALAAPLYDRVQKRDCTFKMTAKEKKDYQIAKTVFMLGDKDNFISHRNKGKKEI